MSESNTDRPRVLIISCHFPPVGGAGVQRPTKFVKYLREFGWEPTVLTVENPSVPAFDESLLKDLPEGLRIVKARTLEPGYKLKGSVSANTGGSKAEAERKPNLFVRVKGKLKGVARKVVLTALQPDPQVLWTPAATKVARRLLQETPHEAIFVTAPPYSAFFIGERLKREFGLPLILDFRDEWDLSSKYLENGHRDRLSGWIQRRMKHRVLKAADVVLGTTPASARRLAEQVRETNGTATGECIYNGFDADDFDDLPIASESVTDGERRRLRIVYAGTLWNLTDAATLVEAVRRVHANDSDLASRLELVFFGRRTTEQEALLSTLGDTSITLTRHGYVPHSEAVEMMASADALCLLLAKVPGAERVVPAKMFEYLALRRPVLSLLPDGEASAIMRPFFPKSTFDPSDIDGIAAWLTERLRNPSGEAVDHDEALLSPYLRREQTSELAAILDRLTDRERSQMPIEPELALVGEVPS